MKKLLILILLITLSGCSKDELDLSDYTKVPVVMAAWQEVNVYDYMIEDIVLDDNDSIYLEVGDQVSKCDFYQEHDGSTIVKCDRTFTDSEWLEGFLEGGNHIYYKELD